MELDWRNRCVGGERLEDLCAVVHELNAANDEELLDKLWDDPHAALPFHRALLRIGAELLWQRASTLAQWRVVPEDDYGTLMFDSFDELLRRAGLAFEREGAEAHPD